MGEVHVVPITRFKESRESWVKARERIGDREGRWRKGELDGVSRSRLFEGVDAIVSPLACGRVSLGLSAVYRYHRDLDGIPETGEGRRLGNMSVEGDFLSRGAGYSRGKRGR